MNRVLKQQLEVLVPEPPNVPPSRQADIDLIRTRAIGLMEAVAIKVDMESTLHQTCIGAIASACREAMRLTLEVTLKATGRELGVDSSARDEQQIGKSSLIDDALRAAGDFLHSR